MDVTQHGPVAILQSTVNTALNHPLLSLLATLILVCVYTRIASGIRYSAAISKLSQSSTGPKTVPILPYWMPWLGHGISFVSGGTGFLTREARSLGPNGSIYALSMANSTHNVVTSPSIARQILIDRNSPITMEPFVYHTMKTFWDDHGSIKAVEPNALWNNIHGVLTGMLRESFVTTAIKGTVQRVEERTWNLVSGLESPVDQSSWERLANVEIVSKSSSDNSFVAEASLFPLLRYFVGNIATDVLFGHNFIENYPDIMQDLFEMDSRFNLFLAGTPSWVPGMASASMARERIINAVLDHHDAYFKYVVGQDPGPRWSDMSDVSTVIADRAIEFRKAGSAPRGWATGNGAILWAMNINANPVIFWMVRYIYSDPTLLEELRREVAPYVRIKKAADTGLPIKEAPRLDIDIAALWTKCPLLKGAFFETMRLEAASMSYKMVEEDFVVTESEQDARMLGKNEAQSYLLRKGELICIPHGVHQSDEKYFRDPERFDPRRFWAKDAEKDNSGGEDVRVEYGTMKVWGGGKQMCKGKTFAEREVVLFAAAIVMQWDMVPVGNGGKWVHPGRKVGAGAVTPVKDVRVRLSRREAW
ncbi:hypothetical protein PV11_01697 [Exophiala sideris]|uniref:Cytochrome P450 n=1 Tax=Exophiala sideris TaxID=1016849 RepID=A0A0D1ZGX5_9EURO|nr:hypothetical protein PV11_01697 [Exophiala sideris]